MIWLVQTLWRYRTEIILGVQLLAKLRKTAQEAMRDYIRRIVRERLQRQIAIVSVQLLLILAATWANAEHPGLPSQMASSVLLWTLTLYNGYGFYFVSIPEFFAVRKMLRGKTGYALKHLLGVSVVSELLQFHVIILALCLGLAVSSRTWLGTSFSYLQPWINLLGF